MSTKRTAPLGVVQACDLSGRLRDVDPVGIWAYQGIYESIGVTGDSLASWEDLYGMDSLGVGGDGTLLAPGFPVLSRVAWMYIDPIALSASETEALVGECEKAMSSARDASAREELRRIRDLGLTAISRAAFLRFGHP